MESLGETEASGVFTESVRQLGRGGDVVRLKRAAVLEVFKENLEEMREQKLNEIDVAQRRGVIVNLTESLEKKYGMSNWQSGMSRLFDKYEGELGGKVPEVVFDNFWSAVESKYGNTGEFRTMLKNEPLVLEYLYSQITGSGLELNAAVLRRMQEHRDLSSVRLNEKTVEIETSLKSIYGEQSVIGDFLAKQGGTIDTPISLFIPITGQQRVIYEKYLSSGSANLRLDDGQFFSLLEKIKERSGLLGMQHGYGADRRVYRRAAGRMLGGGEVGIAMTTKGGEGTTLRNESGIVSGHMDLAAVQVATALQALGLVGNDIEKETHMRGHSMAGEEMFWLAMYAQRGWKMTHEVFTPVIGNQKEFLTLFGGGVRELKDIPGLINRLSVEIPWLLTRVTKSEQVGELAGKLIGKAATLEVKGTSLGRLIASYLIDSGENYDQAEIEEIIAVHVENLTDYWYNQAVYRALTQDIELSDEVLVAMRSFYGDRFTAIWIAEDDRILDSGRMSDRLRKTGWRSKLRFMEEAGHYVTAAKGFVPVDKARQQKTPPW